LETTPSSSPPINEPVADPAATAATTRLLEARTAKACPGLLLHGGRRYAGAASRSWTSSPSAYPPLPRYCFGAPAAVRAGSGSPTRVGHNEPAQHSHLLVRRRRRPR
jgi:hypothetical protein